MTKRFSDYEFKVVVSIRRCTAEDQADDLESEIRTLLETVDEIVEWQENQFQMTFAHARIIFWFKHEKHAILTALRCS